MGVRESLTRAVITTAAGTHVAIHRLTRGRVGAGMDGDVEERTDRTIPVARLERLSR